MPSNSNRSNRPVVIPTIVPGITAQSGNCQIGIAQRANALYALEHPQFTCSTHGPGCAQIGPVRGGLHEAAKVHARRLRKQIAPAETAWVWAMRQLPEVPLGAKVYLWEVGETLALGVPEAADDEIVFGGLKFHLLPPDKWQFIEALRTAPLAGVERLRLSELLPEADWWRPNSGMTGYDWRDWVWKHARALSSMSRWYRDKDFGPAQFFFLWAGFNLLNAQDVIMRAPVFAGTEVRGERLGALLVDLTTQEAWAVPLSEWNAIPRKMREDGEGHLGAARLDLLLPATGMSTGETLHYGQVALVPQGTERVVVYFHPSLPGEKVTKRELFPLHDIAVFALRRLGISMSGYLSQRGVRLPDFAQGIPEAGLQILQEVAGQLVAHSRWPDLNGLGLDVSPATVGEMVARALSRETTA